MPEPKRFDPLGWFVSACFVVLVGAIALTVAVHLVRAIWLWLVVGAIVVVLAGVALQLLSWWRRRQLW